MHSSITMALRSRTSSPMFSSVLKNQVGLLLKCFSYSRGALKCYYTVYYVTSLLITSVCSFFSLHTGWPLNYWPQSHSPYGTKITNLSGVWRRTAGRTVKVKNIRKSKTVFLHWKIAKVGKTFSRWCFSCNSGLYSSLVSCFPQRQSLHRTVSVLCCLRSSCASRWSPTSTQRRRSPSRRTPGSSGRSSPRWQNACLRKIPAKVTWGRGCTLPSGQIRIVTRLWPPPKSPNLKGKSPNWELSGLSSKYPTAGGVGEEWRKEEEWKKACHLTRSRVIANAYGRQQWNLVNPWSNLVTFLSIFVLLVRVLNLCMATLPLHL